MSPAQRGTRDSIPPPGSALAAGRAGVRRAPEASPGGPRRRAPGYQMSPSVKPSGNGSEGSSE